MTLPLLGVVLGLLTVAIALECPSIHDIYIKETNKCISFSSTMLLFDDAEMACQSKGGHLASISDSDVEAAVIPRAVSLYGVNGFVWIGGRTARNSTWAWSDGTPWNYTNWRIEPESGPFPVPSCVLIDLQSKAWVYQNFCESAEFYLCAIPAVVTVTPQISTTLSPTPSPTSLTTPSPGTGSKCPHQGVYNIWTQKCYKLMSEPLPFEDAELSCQAMGGHLASIDSVFTNADISALMPRNVSHYWVGAKVIGSMWFWIDGTPFGQLAPQPYLNFPNPQDEWTATLEPRCLFIRGTGYWYGDICNRSRPYICAFPINQATNTTTTTAAAETITPKKPLTTTQPPLQTCPPPAARCHDGWTALTSTNSCYKVLFNNDFWSAERKCNEIGAHLSSIHSLEENDFIKEISQSGIVSQENGAWVWIGLYRNNGTWTWTDGSTYDYKQWASLEPNTNFQCVKLVPDNWGSNKDLSQIGRWWCNESCETRQRAFVCKKKALQVGAS